MDCLGLERLEHDAISPWATTADSIALSDKSLQAALKCLELGKFALHLREVASSNIPDLPAILISTDGKPSKQPHLIN
jgi:hypothetical protein